VASLTPLFYLFSTYGNIWPTLLHNLLGAAFWCGANLAATSSQLYTPDDKRPSYVAFFSCFTSLFGSFLGILAGGAILEGISQSSILSAIIQDRYKFMIALSVILRISAVLILIPMMDNTREHTVNDMFRAFLIRLKIEKNHINYWWNRRK
jgi:hypothetical protein